MTLYRVLVGRHSTAAVYLEAESEDEAASTAIEMIGDIDEEEYEHEHYDISAVVDVVDEQDATLGSVIANTGKSVVEYLNERLSAAEED